MKNSSNVFWYVFGGMFGFLVLGLLTDRLVAIGGSYGSTEFGNWAMWAGSGGTTFTLIFLIIQNISLRSKQDKADKKQEEMWQNQKENISIQKYQTHK
ncbi:hypothetical protein [Vibrio sp. 99-8-1]|uniref:hypothetical protein n=1 Tax=Vibrio sp. 99-8-1 TaxID=2607602 RepID=UPI0014939D72|nr:hypothetical protein [Vibrio sp. 99-8-1]NOI65988.1 hypothetical protein [Vibrio sp. 99-8-1]